MTAFLACSDFSNLPCKSLDVIIRTKQTINLTIAAKFGILACNGCIRYGTLNRYITFIGLLLIKVDGDNVTHNHGFIAGSD